jgi:hypothetical protein
MPITLNCGCGKILRIPDEHAGKRVKCPACNGILSAAPPQPAMPAFEVVEDEPKQLAPARPVAKPARPHHDEEEDDDYPVRKAERSAAKPQPAFRTSADDDDDQPRPKRKKKRKIRKSRSAGFLGGPDAGRRIGYVVGGGFAVVIGIALAVWGNDGEGRGASRLLIFGVLVAIGGLISVVQGVTGNMPDPDDE